MSEPATNPPAISFIQPGTLWELTQQKTESARQCGALKSIETEYQAIKQEDVFFVVRTLSNLKRKEQTKKKQNQKEKKTGKRIDPFLPYEPELFVGDISNSHLCLLNKFNVVDNHLLIVTRAFEEQTDLLNLEDFAALWFCLQEIDGLAFFNGGEIAGASQRHKHLQLIPLPFIADVVYLPIGHAIASAAFQDSLGTISSFPFRHGVASLDLSLNDDPQTAAKVMLQQYHSLLDLVGIKGDRHPKAYNLLATRNWMLIVPRSQHSFANIPVNSLGFAGSLFIRDQDSWELLKQLTPLELLKNVAFPKD